MDAKMRTMWSDSSKCQLSEASPRSNWISWSNNVLLCGRPFGGVELRRKMIWHSSLTLIRVAKLLLLTSQLLCLMSGLRAETQSCDVLTENDKRLILTYLRRQFDLPDEQHLTFDAIDQMGNTCYRRLTIRGLHSDESVIVYLSPDKRYLSSAVADVTSDPRELKRIARQQLDAKLTATASLPMEHKTGIVITEFIDYQCPYCKQFASWLAALPPALREQVSIRYINLPLPMHQWSRSAALYALCVGESESDLTLFQKILFEKQNEIKDTQLQNVVERAFPTRARTISACQKAPTTLARLDEQLALAKELHVSGTPTFFLDGRQIFIKSQGDLIKLVDVKPKALNALQPASEADQSK